MISLRSTIHLFAPMLIAGVVGLFLNAPLIAQVGGQLRVVYRFDGPSADFELGNATSFAGDVNNDGFDDILIGAPNGYHNGLQTGSAYVFSGADGSLLFVRHGSLSDDRFGEAVANAGDINNDGYNDFIIGAPFGDPGGLVDAGSAFIYSGANGSVLFRFDGALAQDRLGSSVDSAGDVDGDGTADVIIGIPRWNGVVESEARIYSGATGGILRTMVLNPNQASFNTGFAKTVAGIGDIDGDGFADTLVGAPDADTNPWYASSGYAISYSGIQGDGHSHQGPSLRDWEYFGRSIDGTGDIDGDGFDDYIVGALHGYASVFSGYSGNHIYRYFSSDRGDFGERVAGTGDMDGDGTPDFIMSGGDDGQASVFSGATGLILFVINDPEHRPFSRFGSNGLAAGGDINGDGRPEIIVGDSGTDFHGTSSGSVYAFTWDVFLSSNTRELSGSTGGTIDFSLDFPPSAALYRHRVLISGTGVGPTTFGVDIPLTHDRLLVETNAGNYRTAIATNMHGSLDVNGDATASLTLPANLPPGLIGRTFWFAAIANPAGQLPEYSSVALSLEITP